MHSHGSLQQTPRNNVAADYGGAGKWVGMLVYPNLEVGGPHEAGAGNWRGKAESSTKEATQRTQNQRSGG